MSKINNSNEMSRRKFMGLAGGALGMAAIASMGVAGWAANKLEIDPEALEYLENETDVLIIGGGMAGLFAAVKAHDAGAKTLMVSKGRLGSSGETPFAKGIFAYDPSTTEMSLDEFTDGVSRSAIGTNNPIYTRQMAEHSLDRVNELREWGFFDSALYNKSFSKPIEERNIDLLERIVITNLIKENGKICGAAGFSLDEEKVYIFKAKSVVLCTGAGGFKPNGFPICDLTHDGTIMAYNIGAKVTGKEWNDGHPGQATNSAACFDGWHGMFERVPSVESVGIRHDLGVDLNYMAYTNGNPVQMGPPGASESKKVVGGPYVPAEFSQRGPDKHDDGPKDGPKDGKHPRGGKPGEGGKDGEAGSPPGMGGVSVGGSSAGMAIHKSEGLVPINDKCESTIPGLFAAGDALGSYMAGAIYTQIGSSLAGSAVQGGIAGKAAAEYSADKKIPNISKTKIKEIKEEMLAPLHRTEGYSPAWVTQTLQGIMIPNFIIYIKKEGLLKAALAYIEELRDHHIPMLKAADLHELRLAHETVNMITTAEMKLKASILRTESRCSHYRLDYPETDKENWQAWINIFKGEDGRMKFEKQAFDSWPASGKPLEYI
ncbi:FAD-binding protein [Ancylomarina sp. 16SWW S1-10-2]|uniref:FAD-dependent oxidoreductase n=1 Tax=Ancylomarina sp. 16SWW S1-10-2 TaxID=2499681 RepID=UPI0012AE75D0|nr:FAD-binding protein [Ancylomarina sp. 16SWW S1-10-2]MRT93525.1 FAD-binding protein [Ancylomarina sp. 16SWW S1-10-2]